MTPFVANTDRRWFDFLSTRMTGGVIDEVNFWQPRSKRPMKRMQPGEPVFFRLKKPTYAIAGYGFFAHFECLTIEMAWRLFGWRNGADSEAAFLDRIGGYRRADLLDPAQRRRLMGCTILRDVRLWPDHVWMPWNDSRGWQRNIVQGRTETGRNASDLLARLALDTQPLPADLGERFHPLDFDERVFVERRVARREGQGTFRLRLQAAYGGCAITGECTQPVLDAAHIQPYLGPASNHVQNGLLLTKEWHTLFDSGYVTVTPDYQIKVSEALREVWNNGHRYYPFHGQPLRRCPQSDALKPSRDALAWHAEHCFMS